MTGTYTAASRSTFGGDTAADVKDWGQENIEAEAREAAASERAEKAAVRQRLAEAVLDRQREALAVMLEQNDALRRVIADVLAHVDAVALRAT